MLLSIATSWLKKISSVNVRCFAVVQLPAQSGIAERGDDLVRGGAHRGARASDQIQPASRRFETGTESGELLYSP